MLVNCVSEKEFCSFLPGARSNRTHCKQDPVYFPIVSSKCSDDSPITLPFWYEEYSRFFCNHTKLGMKANAGNS